MTKLSPKELVRFALRYGNEDDLRAVIDKLLYVVDYDAQVALSRIVRDPDVSLDLRVELAGRLSGDVALGKSIVMEPKILEAIRNNGFATDGIIQRTHDVASRGYADVFSTEYLFSDHLDWSTVRFQLRYETEWDEFYTEEVLDRLDRAYWSASKSHKDIVRKAQTMVLAHAWKITEDDLVQASKDRRNLEAIMSREDLPFSILEGIWQNRSFRSSIPVEWYTISKNSTTEFLSRVAKELGDTERSRLTQTLIQKYIYG